MPEAVSFRVTTYHKLAKGETGLTQLASARIDAGAALDWILAEFPDEAVTFTLDASKVTIAIDWAAVPDSLRFPKLTARRR